VLSLNLPVLGCASDLRDRVDPSDSHRSALPLSTGGADGQALPVFSFPGAAERAGLAAVCTAIVIPAPVRADSGTVSSAIVIPGARAGRLGGAVCTAIVIPGARKGRLGGGELGGRTWPVAAISPRSAPVQPQCSHPWQNPRMELTWYGRTCIRLKGRDAVVVADAYQAVVGPTGRGITADIVTYSHPDDTPLPRAKGRTANDGATHLPTSLDEAFILDGPGEYEVRHVLVNGVPSLEPDAGAPIPSQFHPGILPRVAALRLHRG
jgi:hypothetical protein